jgi:hypothetical protein
MRTNGYGSWRRFAPLACLFTLLGVTGCGSNLYPVHGRVVYEDDTPMTEGFVICETQADGATVMARGEIQSDGTFRLGTRKPGDGARAGKYRVLVTPRGRTAKEEKTLPPVLDSKYQHYGSSGLGFEVKEGDNDFTLKVSKPASRRR